MLLPLIYASWRRLWRRRAGFCRPNPSVGWPERKLRPNNLYRLEASICYSILRWPNARCRGKPLPPQWAGFEFFDVFGPNNITRAPMMSVLARRFDDVKAGPAPFCNCSSRIAMGSPTAISAAISSMSTTWCGFDDVAVWRRLLFSACSTSHRHRAQFQGT